MKKQSGLNQKSVLIPLPESDFDPTEVAIAYQVLKHYRVVFATPNGKVSTVDERMLSGEGLGFLSRFLTADDAAIKAYHDMIASYVFNHPISYKEIEPNSFDVVVLPGGHAAGIKTYLESKILQDVVRSMNSKNKLIAAIRHGVLVAGRSGVLRGKKVTALPKRSELLIWTFTKKKLGNYYRTYPETTVEDEIKTFLEDANNFQPGPPTLFRDSLKKLWPGFIVTDGNLITARWPGDAHKFALEIREKLRSLDTK